MGSALLVLAATMLGGSAPSAASETESLAPRLTVVRFGCEERDVARRMEERVWSSPRIRAELARGWDSERRESCAAAGDFVRLVGERGVLAACVLDGRGAVLGVLRGAADVEGCLEFLAACRAEHERATGDGVPDRVGSADARIALGAWSALEDELRCLVEEARARSEPDPLLAELVERRARLLVLRGAVAESAETLVLARSIGLDALPPGRARGRVTEALAALAARRTAVARALVPQVLVAIETAPVEQQALLRIAEGLHECGEEGLALDVCAALEAGAPTPTTLRALRALREHVLTPASHRH